MRSIQLLYFLAGFLLLITASEAYAQDNDPVQASRPDVGVTLGGDIQPRVSAGFAGDETRLGYGLRRARLAATVSIGDRLGIFLRAEFAAGSLFAQDAYLIYHADQWRFRLGRVPSAQPRALGQTASAHLDAVDRAAIAERWGQRTRGADGRDFGLEAQYENEQSAIIFFLHNGDGDWSRIRGNYREGISAPPVTAGVENDGLAASIYVNHHVASVPGLEVGGFVGYNGARNPNTEFVGTGRSYTSGSAHVYWGADPGSQPLRLKVDVIGIRYESAPIGPDTFTERSTALALLGAARPREASEVFLRYEYDYRPDVVTPDQFVTAGGSLSISALRGEPYHHERLTLAYGLIPARNGFSAQHLLVLQAQITF